MIATKSQFEVGVRWLIVSLALFLLMCVPLVAQVNKGGLLDTFNAPKPKYVAASVLNFDSLQPGQQAVIAVVVDIADGFHSQSATPSDPNFVAFNITPATSTLATFLPARYPPGVDKTYPALGKLNVYSGKVVAFVPLTISPNAPVGPLTLSTKLTLQICDENVCFAPETVTLQIKTTVVAAGQPVQPTSGDVFATFDPTAFIEQSPGVAVSDLSFSFLGYAVSLGSIWAILPVAILVGVMFNIVPCVLPVLPLKAIGFYETAKHNRAKCFRLGVVFSLGIVATFTLLGVVVFALRWFQWGEFFGNPYFSGAITVILVVMALGMMGLFEFALPTSVYSFSPRHDTYTGNFLFGILTAVLSTPCTFGPFFAVIVWGANQPGYVGTLLLSVVGFGMALPYLILSAFPELARKFPRTGPWSNVVKQMMGIVLLGVAIFFASPILPESYRDAAVWWAIFGVIVIAAVFLLVRTVQLAPRVRPILISTVIAALMIVPAFLAVRVLTHHFPWQKYSQVGLTEARQSGRPVVVKFTAAWCANCHVVEAVVFGDDATAARLKSLGVAPIKVDLTSPDAAGWALLKQLNTVGSIPFTAVYLPGQDEPVRLSGIYSSSDLFKAIGQ